MSYFYNWIRGTSQALCMGLTSQVALVVKNLLASAGDARDSGLILGSGRSPGVGNGNTLQFSCLENPVDREAWWAAVHGVAKRVRHNCATEHTQCEQRGKQSSHAGGLGMNRWNLADGDSSHFRTNSCFCTVLYISHSKWSPLTLEHHSALMEAKKRMTGHRRESRKTGTLIIVPCTGIFRFLTFTVLWSGHRGNPQITVSILAFPWTFPFLAHIIKDLHQVWKLQLRQCLAGPAPPSWSPWFCLLFWLAVSCGQPITEGLEKPAAPHSHI